MVYAVKFTGDLPELDANAKLIVADDNAEMAALIADQAKQPNHFLSEGYKLISDPVERMQRVAEADGWEFTNVWGNAEAMLLKRGWRAPPAPLLRGRVMSCKPAAENNAWRTNAVL